MESTGIYWVPLFALLERRGFAVFLADPRQTRPVAGRPKTAVLDCAPTPTDAINEPGHLE